MSMSKLWTSKLKDPADAPLRAEVAMRVYQRGTLGTGSIPALPEWPYIMFGFEETIAIKAVRETTTAEVYPGLIYIYDVPGSYVRIKRIHRLVKETLLELVGATDPADGTHCLDITFERRGREAYDPVEKQALMTAEYRVVQTEK